MIGVNEIELFPGVTGKERRGFPGDDAVPAYLGYGKRSCGKTTHCSGDDAEARYPGRLLAALKERLESETDAEERFSLEDVLPKRTRVAFGPQPFHGAPETSDPGEDKFLRFANIGGRTDVGDFETEGPDGIADTANVAGAVIK